MMRRPSVIGKPSKEWVEAFTGKKHKGRPASRRQLAEDDAPPDLAEQVASATQGAGQAEADELRRIPLNRLSPSPTNPRKQFDEKAIEELAASIRDKGVLQPILVREKKRVTKLTKTVDVAELDGYEIVAGERRVRAARLAGLIVIPAIVRRLTDLQVLEIQCVENLQRQDLGALEEARGYQQLVDQHGYSVEDLAAKLGKSKAYVYGVLKLCQLPAKAAAAVESGQMPRSTAQLIARVPSAKLREQAAKMVMKGEGRFIRGDHDNEPLSFREAKTAIEREYMVELKSAPFSLVRADLVPEAGSCEQCPKRTGNNRELFPDGRADVCTDPDCYHTKEQAHQAELLQAAKDSGKTVLSAAESKKVFADYDETRVSHRSGYLDLKDQDYEDGRARSYKQILGNELEAETVVAVDGLGQLHELVPKDKAEKILRQKQGRGRSTNGSGDRSWRRYQQQQQEKAKLEAAIARRLSGQVIASAEKQFGDLVGWRPRHLELLRMIVACLMREVWQDNLKKICRQRRLDLTVPRNGSRNSILHVRLGALIDGMEARALLGLLAEVAAVRVADDRDAINGRFWKLFGVDKQKVEKQVKAELAAKKGKKKARTS